MTDLPRGRGLELTGHCSATKKAGHPQEGLGGSRQNLGMADRPIATSLYDHGGVILCI